MLLRDGEEKRDEFFRLQREPEEEEQNIKEENKITGSLSQKKEKEGFAA
jgi:hypothetical protein